MLTFAKFVTEAIGVKYPMPPEIQRYGLELVKNRLSPEEVRLLKNYSGKHHIDINAFLRGETPEKWVSRAKSPEGHRKLMVKATQILDGIFEKSQLPQDVQTFKGVDVRRWRITPDMMESLVGNTITIPEYLSTSISKHTASIYAQSVKSPRNPSDAYACRCDITIPKGTHAIPMVYGVTLSEWEKEILLPRNTKLRVTFTGWAANMEDESRITNYWVMKATVVA
jgi:hypothetical protein